MTSTWLLDRVLPRRALRLTSHDYRWWTLDGDEYERFPWGGLHKW